MIFARFVSILPVTLVLYAINYVDGSVVFKNSTSVQQLTSMNKNPTGYDDLSCSISVFVDNVENVWYHFVSENMQIGNENQAVISNIYDNQLNPYNNSLNPIQPTLPLQTGISGWSFDQCSNPITNDIIFCYSPPIGGEYLYINCKIFYNDHANSSYWTKPFVVSNPLDNQYTPVTYVSIICFDDAYFVSWMYAPLQSVAQSLRYTLIALNATIIQNDVIICQINSQSLLVGSLGTVKADFIATTNKTDFIITYVYKPNRLRCIMGEYSNYMVQFDQNTFNKELKIYYDSKEEFSVLTFAPISMDINEKCCYLIPYRTYDMYEALESIYFTIIDKTGNQILNDTAGKDGDILIQNAPKNDEFVSNQMLKLSMLNQQNSSNNYFMSLYSMETFKRGVAGVQYIQGNVYNVKNIDDNYNLETVVKDVSFVKNMEVDGAFANSVCAQVLPVNNDDAVVIVWSQWQQIDKDIHQSYIFGQTWTVTNS